MSCRFSNSCLTIKIIMAIYWTWSMSKIMHGRLNPHRITPDRVVAIQFQCKLCFAIRSMCVCCRKNARAIQKKCCAKKCAQNIAERDSTWAWATTRLPGHGPVPTCLTHAIGLHGPVGLLGPSDLEAKSKKTFLFPSLSRLLLCGLLTESYASS